MRFKEHKKLNKKRLYIKKENFKQLPEIKSARAVSRRGLYVGRVEYVNDTFTSQKWTKSLYWVEKKFNFRLYCRSTGSLKRNWIGKYLLQISA